MIHRRLDIALIFVIFTVLYVLLAWIACGGDKWWVIDYVDNSNVFFGDDAYRFFLARSAWINPDIYTYNYVLPGFLVLDGVVTSLARGDIFWARAIHAVLGAGSLCLIWDSGRLLGLNRIALIGAICVIGFLPRYAITALSFYGEAWLGFIICSSIWLYIRKDFLLLAIVASLLPLIRPEGIFFLGGIWIFMLKGSRWREAFLMVLPGFIYFVYLNINLDSFSDYNYWRFELRRILSKLELNSSNWDIAKTYSPIFYIPAFLGVLFQPIRRLWPFLVVSIFWLIWLQQGLYTGLSTYEDRYTYVLIPIAALLWGAFLSWIWQSFPILFSSSVRKFSLTAFFSLAVVWAHISSIYPLKINLEYNGYYLTFEKMLSGEWDKLFWHYEPRHVAAWKGLSSRIVDQVHSDRGIDKIVIFDHQLYYFLDPYDLPERVVVGFPSSGYMVFHTLLGGQIFIQRPRGRMYSYLQLGEPDFRRGERRLLYADLMPLFGYPYVWKQEEYELYMFSYQESFSPERDISAAPMVGRDELQDAVDALRLEKEGL